MDVQTMAIFTAVIALVLYMLFKGKKVRSLGLTLPKRIAQHAEYIQSASQEFGVDPGLIAAVIEKESNGDKKDRGQDGEVGLMQILPIATRELQRRGFKSIPSSPAWNPLQNIRQGTATLSYLLDIYNGDQFKALTAYNGGPTEARHEFNVPGDQQAERYAVKVLKIKKSFENG